MLFGGNCLDTEGSCLAARLSQMSEAFLAHLHRIAKVRHL
jgi:hypothetical protein